MIPTLRNLGQELIVSAYHEHTQEGLKDLHIVVDLDGAKHPTILAATIVSEGEDGKPCAIINVNPALRDLPETRQKMVLAHEWVHSMVALRDGKVGEVNSVDKVQMLIFSGWLRRRSLWCDSPEQLNEMHTALRQLLVSRESVEEMLTGEFHMSIEELAALVREDPNRAYLGITNLVLAFAGKWTVDEDLVFDRLREMLMPIM